MFSPVPHFQQTFPALSHSILPPAEMLSITPRPRACSFPPPTVFRMNFRTLLAMSTGTNFLQGHVCREGLQDAYPTSASRLRVLSRENSACAPAECPQMHILLSRVVAPRVMFTSSKSAFASSGVRFSMNVIRELYHLWSEISKRIQLHWFYL